MFDNNSSSPMCQQKYNVRLSDGAPSTDLPCFSPTAEPSSPIHTPNKSRLYVEDTAGPTERPGTNMNRQRYKEIKIQYKEFTM